MLHRHRIEGIGYALRPVEADDAELIVRLRTDSRADLRYIHPTSPDPAKQARWLSAYFSRERDYYWVLDRLGSRSGDGLAGIYNVDPAARSAEWGRWVIAPGSLGALESVWLVHVAAFEVLDLERLYCITVAEHASVLSFHDSFGLKRAGYRPGRVTLEDRCHDAIEHVCLRSEWPALKAKNEPQIRRIARMLEHKLNA